jgi:hypothetical protein
MDLDFRDDSICLRQGVYWREGVSYARVSTLLDTRWPFTGGQSTASDLGTRMHAAIDAYLAAPTEIAWQTSELGHFGQFVRDHPELVCIGHEFPVFDPLLRVAGTCDALFYDTITSNMILVDWKRTRGLYPSSAERYQMQLSIYANLIKGRYCVDIDSAMLVLLHPDNDTYKAIVVPLLAPVDFMRDALATIGLPMPPLPTSSTEPETGCAEEP